MHPNWLLIIRVPIIWCYVPLAWWVWTRNYVSACVVGEIYHVMPLLGALVGSFTWPWWTFHHMWWMFWSEREKIKHVLWWCSLNIFFLLFFALSQSIEMDITQRERLPPVEMSIQHAHPFVPHVCRVAWHNWSLCVLFIRLSLPHNADTRAVSCVEFRDRAAT